jgi:zinc protease
MSSVGEGQDLDVRVTEVDGVPTFWMPVDGPLTASLMFRVGRADERLWTGGITHLVEHLALYPLGARDTRFSFNAYVDAVTTVFYAQASEDEVVGYLEELCRNLHEMPHERLDVEKKILRSEASQHTPTGAIPSMLRWRYGAKTFGLPSYEEFGLHHLDSEAVRSWAADNFTRGNAALWLTGPPPAGLTLRLPDGERKRPPAPSTALNSLPAWYAEGAGVASMLTVVERSSAATLLRHLLEQRLRAKLRYELGASYAPQVGYDHRTGSDASLWILAEAVEGHEEAVCAGVVAALDEVGSGQCDERDIAQWRDQMFGVLHEPGARRGLLHGRCWDHLQGGGELTWDELRHRIETVDQTAVTEVAAAAAKEALYRLPEGQAPASSEIATAPIWSKRRFSGREFPLMRMSAEEELHTLIAGDEGITLRRVDSYNTVSIPFADCEALLRWPDGHRVMFGADGFMLQITPGAWIDGSGLVTIIDRRCDPQRQIDMPAVDVPPPSGPVVTEPLREWLIAIALVAITVAFTVRFAVTGKFLLGAIIWGVVAGYRVNSLRLTRQVRGMRGFPTRWRAKK